MDEEDRQMLRIIAQMEVQNAITMRDLVIREMTTSLRWVQTSLLLVNGGAAVAILQTDIASPATTSWAGACFVVGIILALLTATTGVRISRDTPKKLTEILGYWMTVSVDLLRSEEIELRWLQYTAILDKRARLPRMLGYLSVGAFILGCAIVGVQAI